MGDAVIVDVVRTPGGRRNGSLSGWHPADLAGEVLSTLVERNDLDPALVEDVIMGCVSQVGAQGLNVGRNAVLAAGFPESVPATTIDRQCGSSQQAAAFAAQAVMAGVHDIVIAAGVEVMSLVPDGGHVRPGRRASRSGRGSSARYADAGGLIPQGLSAELIATQWGLTRDRDRRVLGHVAAAGRPRPRRGPLRPRDPPRAPPAAATRRPARSSPADGMVRADEGIRDDTTVETLARLKPAFDPEGVITAGNSSQITDGASAALIMSEAAAERLGLTPRARFHAFALAGVDPGIMLTGPIPGHHQGAREGGPRPSTTSTWSRSTRPSPRWCWPGSASCTPTWRR